MKSRDRSFHMAWQLLLVLTFAVAGASKQPQPTAEKQFTPLINSVKGPDLFRAYCASCRGFESHAVQRSFQQFPNQFGSDSDGVRVQPSLTSSRQP